MAPARKKKGQVSTAVEPGYKPRVKPDTWHALNRNHMQNWVANTFTKAPSSLPAPDTCSLFSHQHIIKDFMQPESPYRGLMLYHSLGSGKTRGSISIAEVMSTKYKVNVMVLASLASNYTEEIRQCGNEMYRTTGRWEFVSIKQKGEYDKDVADAVALGVTEQTIKRNGGVWVRAPAASPAASNFSNLNGEQRAHIFDQIEDMIRSRYNFINYNGLNTKSITALVASVPEGTSPFDNSVIIIDEAHNLVSRIVNNRPIARELYRLIMSARNAKIILLSGTPIINKPVELAVLANMVRGFMPYITLSGTGLNAEQWQGVETFVDKHPRVDHYEIDRIKSIMTIYPVTEGFEWADKDAYLIRRAPNHEAQTTAALRSEIEDTLRTLNAKMRTVQIKDNGISKLLPDVEEDFDKMFVDWSALRNNQNPVTNQMILSRRLQGIVSYYESFDPALFPSVSQTNIVKIPMGDEVFKGYMNVRQEEFAKEAKAKMNRKRAGGGSNEHNSGNTFRAFSRVLCTYAFPATIKRPYPSTVAKLKYEGLDENIGSIDDDLRENNEEEPARAARAADDVKNKYLAHLARAVKELKKGKEQYLMGRGLEQLGPKYTAMLERIDQSPGHVLVYSQFRNVEGLGILMMVLQAHGWAEFAIAKNANGEWELDIKEEDALKPKYAVFSGDKERTKMLMHIYNNEFDDLPPKLLKSIKDMHDDKRISNLRGDIIRIMMITQSGAEGISLKNVRQVHIMEPYWNQIRIKQVIGRAVRAGSHLALPTRAEQHVDVYLYMTVFSEKQLKNSTVVSRENKITSDEYIYDVSLRKSRITDQLLSIAKASAIDCVVHKKTHNDNVQCARYPANFGAPVKGVLYSYLGVHEDPTDETVKKQTRYVGRPIGFVRCVKPQKSDSSGKDTSSARIPYYKDTMEALRPSKYFSSDGKDREVIGRIVRLEDGSPQVVLYTGDADE